MASVSLESLQAELLKLKTEFPHVHLKKAGSPFPISVKTTIERPIKYNQFDLSEFKVLIVLSDQYLSAPQDSFRIEVLSEEVPASLRRAMAAKLTQVCSSAGAHPAALSAVLRYATDHYGPLLSLLPHLLESYMGVDDQDMTVRRFTVLNLTDEEEAKAAPPPEPEPEPKPQPTSKSRPLLPADLLSSGFTQTLVAELEALTIKSAPHGRLQIHLSSGGAPSTSQPTATFVFPIKPTDPAWNQSFNSLLTLEGRTSAASDSDIQMAVVGPLSLSKAVRDALTARLNLELKSQLGRRNWLRRAVASLENFAGAWWEEEQAHLKHEEKEQEREEARRLEQARHDRPYTDNLPPSESEGEEGEEEEYSEDESEEGGDGGADHVYGSGSEDYEHDESDHEEHEPAGPSSSSSGPVAEHSLTASKVQLKGLKLDGIDAMELYKMELQVACSRCGASSDLTLTSDNLDATVPKEQGWFVVHGACSGCSRPISASFLPRIAHAGSNTIAALRTDDCKPIDFLSKNVFGAQCGTCSATNSLRGVESSVPCNRQCSSCFSKLQITFSAPAFVTPKLYSQPRGGGEGEASTSKAGPRTSTKMSIAKEAQIFQQPRVLGQPLPNNGACPHYRYSFRWLRFPCCGKLFPCDLCHELFTDHELKWATRCVCGFCSAEQGCSGECKFCGKKITASSRDPRGTGTRFWEGGLGCRDPKRLNRNDAHKYKGRAKTISRKAARVGAEGKKKREAQAAKKA